MRSKIDSFDGQFAFLSNFFPAEVVFEGISYPTSEHAFQAAKTHDQNKRVGIAIVTSPGRAKRLGRKLPLRKDWNSVRIGIMEHILRIKFSDPELKSRLLNTDDAELIEGNDWGDTFWGVCKGVGENNLGKLLMKIRSDYIAELNRDTNE